MRRGRDIIGKPVVTLDGGLQVATVRDLVFDHEAGQLLALLVDEGGWFRAARVVPLRAIRSFGDDAVVVQNGDDVMAATRLPRIPEILNDDATLVGTTLMTTDGKNLGRLADMYFDEVTGEVVGYDVTGGLFADLSSGRSFVPGAGGLSLGKDVAFVPPETALAMQEAEPGGLKGAMTSAGASLQETYSSVAENTRERQKSFVAGKTSGSDVSLPDGTVLVPAGTVITPQIAERADEAGVLGALFASAGGGLLRDTLDTARDRVRIGYEDLTTASQERQKEFVLGKAAAQDVTAPDGTVIVTRGDTIMPEMADLAQQKNALGILTAAAGGGLVQTGVESARERVTGALDDLSSNARQRQRALVVGRRVNREVIADDGTLIVASGATVSDSDAVRAERHGALHALLLATGAGALENVTSTVRERFASLSGQATPQDHLDPVGRRVLHDVHGTQGRLIAAQGQIVTPAVLGAARTEGREQTLRDATISARSVSNVEDRLSVGAHTVRAGASTLLDRVRETFQELRSNAEEATMERRIHAAIGRPTTRVILDPQDNVILNVGEIITHRAVTDARRTGVLDILLDSVSMETHPLSPDEVKPPGSGRAALDSGGQDERAPRRADVDSRGG